VHWLIKIIGVFFVSCYPISTLAFSVRLVAKGIYAFNVIQLMFCSTETAKKKILLEKIHLLVDDIVP